jgi:spore coat polysaccharide biosynthesis protein SpsF
MHKVIILQARLASDRFPRRVLADLCGEPAIAHIVRRLKTAQRADEICIAIPDSHDEDELADVVNGLDVTVCRGSSSDVLGRFIQAAYQTKADLIIRAKGNDPFVQPEDIDRQIAEFETDPELDYCVTDHFPRGVTTETLRLKTLEKLDYLSRAANEREHVTWYIQRNPGPFSIKRLEAPDNLHKGGVSLSLDTAEDCQFIRDIYSKLCKPGGIVSLDETLRLIEHDEHISSVARKLSAVAVGAA